MMPHDASSLVSSSVLAGISLPAPVSSVAGSEVRALAQGFLTDGSSSRRCAVVIGAFDGVHLGHRTLVAEARDDARRRDLPLVILTFDPDPSAVLSPGRHGDQLLSCDDRLRALAGLGPDALVTLPFDRSMASLSSSVFVDDILMPLLMPQVIHVGQDFRLGAGGAGTVDALSSLGASRGFDVVGHDLVQVGGEAVTATRVRGLVGEGDVAGASDLLGRCHFVSGKVIHGRGEGLSLGFPTANVSCGLAACMPADGVYGGFVRCGGQAWPAAINVGAPPTFSGPHESFLEANLLGFDGDIYGSDVDVVFVERLRPSRRFPSISELKRVVRSNIDWVGENLGEHVVEVGA